MSDARWPTTILQRLQQEVNRDHGWGYRAGLASAAEPTALACMALAVRPDLHHLRRAGLRWLADRQNGGGGVPSSPATELPAWTTGLAVLAWTSACANDGHQYDAQVANAMRMLSRTHGLPLKAGPEFFGHDATLVGWPWVEGTHSWVEPTSYAILAMRAAGRIDNARFRDGIRLLLDRTIPGGGWNYGNTKVLGNTLRPFPATTGLVLCALAGEPRDARIEESLAFLHDALPAIRSPLSLGWGLMGASAWGERPADAAQWLAECATRCLRRSTNTTEQALLLMAADDKPVFLGGCSDVRG